MAVKPISSTPQPQPLKLSETERQVRQKETDNIKRMFQLQKQIEEEQRIAGNRVDRIRSDYAKKEAQESVAQEERYVKQKEKGLANLLDLRRKQKKELSDAKMAGERQLKQLNEYYRDRIYETQTKGEKQLKSLVSSSSLQQQDHQLKSKRSEELLKQDNAAKLQLSRELHRQKLADMQAQHETQTKKSHENYKKATEKSTKLYNDRYLDTLKSHDRALATVFNRSNTILNGLKKDTMQRLSAYSGRQEDPFYKMVDLGAQIEDGENEYVLRAQVPKHEQRYIGVSVKGDEVVVSGKKRSSDTIQKQDGGTQSTSAFQSFTETFKITDTVNPRGIQKEFQGDQLVVRIPKKNHQESKPFQAKEPSRVVLKRPQFPKGI